MYKKIKFSLISEVLRLFHVTNIHIELTQRIETQFKFKFRKFILFCSTLSEDVQYN